MNKKDINRMFLCDLLQLMKVNNDQGPSKSNIKLVLVIFNNTFMVLFVILDLHRPWSLFTFKEKKNSANINLWFVEGTKFEGEIMTRIFFSNFGCTIPLKVNTKENKHTHTHK